MSENRAKEGAAAPRSSLAGNGRSKRTDAPPRGSRSAPPHFQTMDPPDIHEYYVRRAGLQKQVKRKLLKSKLDKLIDYQAMISQEIDELEKDFELAMRATPRYYRPAPQTPPESASKMKFKQFRVVGGSPGNLSYKINTKPGRDGGIRAFSLKVDVKGYVTERVEIDTEDDIMIITASKMNGAKRNLKVVAPTVKDMERAYVHPPKLGILVIDF